MDNNFLSSHFIESHAFLKGIVIVCGCLGGTVLVLLTERWSKLTNNRLKLEYQPLFKGLINKYVYSNPKLYRIDSQYIDLPLDEFKKYHLSYRGIRKILVDEILECHRKYPEEKRRLLKKLYEDLDLDLCTIIDLNLLRGNSLALAIDELSNMEIVVEECRITKFLKHKNSAVQSATRIYLLRMLEINRINEWQPQKNSISLEGLS